MIGVPDDKWGETVKALVVLKPGAVGDRGGADRALPCPPRALQVPDVGRVVRLVRAHGDRQAAEVQDSRAVLGRPRTAGELVLLGTRARRVGGRVVALADRARVARRTARLRLGMDCRGVRRRRARHRSRISRRHTSRIKLATGVVQISARTPAASAMAFATLEAIAGDGRAIAGLGLSGPQIVEGWYGQPWARPIARTRDYVAIMRQVFRREGPVAHAGRAISLPYGGDDATGLGKPLKSILHPNPNLPIYIAAGGPENVALAAEVADGWIPMGLSPANASEFRPVLEKGAARSGRSLDTLAIQASTTVRLTDDVAALDRRDEAPHRAVRRRHGRARHELPQGRDGAPRLRGRRRADPGAVPRGSPARGGRRRPRRVRRRGRAARLPARIAERFRPWTSCGVTGITIHTDQDEAIELMAELAAS